MAATGPLRLWIGKLDLGGNASTPATFELQTIDTIGLPKFGCTALHAQTAQYWSYTEAAFLWVSMMHIDSIPARIIPSPESWGTPARASARHVTAL